MQTTHVDGKRIRDSGASIVFDIESSSVGGIEAELHPRIPVNASARLRRTEMIPRLAPATLTMVLLLALFNAM